MTSKDDFYQQTFTTEFLKRHPTTAADDSALIGIAENHLEDLTNIPGIYFDTDTLTSISISAARHLSDALNNQKLKLENEDIQAAWILVVADFKKKYWSFPTHQEEQSSVRVNIGRELFAYIWAMVQALMIMKVVIFYLGLKSAADAEPKDKFMVFAAICFSFGSLFFFAWRKTRKPKKQKK